MSSETTKNSAHTVIQHADALGSIFSKYSKESPDFTYLPPLVGHGAFIAGATLLVFEISSQDKAINGGHLENYGNKRISQIKDILSLLDTLRIYWRVLKEPVSYWQSISYTAGFLICCNSGRSSQMPFEKVLCFLQYLRQLYYQTPILLSVAYLLFRNLGVKCLHLFQHNLLHILQSNAYAMGTIAKWANRFRRNYMKTCFHPLKQKKT